MSDFLSLLRSAIHEKIASNPALTQQRLAKTLGLKQPQISKILTGKITSGAHLQMIAEHLDIGISDLAKQLQAHPDAVSTASEGEAAVVGINHEAAQPFIKNRIMDGMQRSQEVNISVIAVALHYTWRFLEGELPALLGCFPETKRVHLNLGMVSPEHLERQGLKKWHDRAKKVQEEIRRFADSSASDFRIAVSLFTYENLPHWHGILIDSTDLFLGRTRWNQEIGGAWQLSVGQEPYRLYSASQPAGLERIRMFMSWFDWYRLTGKAVACNRPEEAEDDLPRENVPVVSPESRC